METVRYQGDGVGLVGDAAGPADGAPLLFLHGSGQTRQSWGKALEQAAARGWRAIAIDMRGHGDSDWASDGGYEVQRFADDLRVVLGQFASPPVVVGASLGGIAGMIVAADAPELVRALVLVDITAKPRMEGSQQVIDFMGSAAGGFASLDEAADAVAAYLPHRPRPKDTSGLLKNLRLRDGRYYWHWDPAMQQVGERARDRLAEDGPSVLEAAARRLTVPTLLIRGGRSRIVTEESAAEFLEMVPHADYVHIGKADHMVAGDANDAFNDAIFDFAERVRG